MREKMAMADGGVAVQNVDTSESIPSLTREKFYSIRIHKVVRKYPYVGRAFPAAPFGNSFQFFP